MEIGKYKQMMSYLTRPADKKRLNTIVYDPSIDEEKTHHNLDLKKVEKKTVEKKPVDIQKRILDASAMYDGYVPEGAKVPVAMKPDPKRLMSDKTEQYLRKNLIDKMGRGEALDSSEVRFLMDTKPKQPEASPQQVAELKKKLDKYRYIHGEDKPMKKQKPIAKKKSSVLSIPTTKIDPTPSALLAPIRSADDLERERKFNQLVKEIEDEKKRIRNSGLGALI